MKIQTFVKPKNLHETQKYLLSQDKATIVGGGVFLKLQKRNVPLAIDLSLLDLDYIKEEGHYIRIGAMTNLRSIETAAILPLALTTSVRQIGGVGLRNLVTVGGSVCGRYPFSDINTALLALDATLRFYERGEVSLETFLEGDYNHKDILIEVIIPQLKASGFKCFKSVYTDFSLVNVAVSYDKEWRIAIGARPGGPVLIRKEHLEASDIPDLLDGVAFGDDSRAGKAYRQALAEILLDEAMEEVSMWK